MTMVAELVQDVTNRADDLAEILKGLGHPIRLKIVGYLCERDHGVTELTELLGLKQSLVSQHLGVLRMLGLVRADRTGGTATYSLARPGLVKLVQCLGNCSRG
jgi:ArsR family transcriptional regulator, virulence genes transcriptional regulator